MTQQLRTFGYGGMLIAIFAMIVGFGATASAQLEPAPDQLFTPEQLDYMVAPIALYPDPLISQILVASTYPLEIVEASQWLQRNPNVQGPALAEAALNRDWDPSIQALVVFPDVLKYLTEDIAWTTNLGNAFLAQEGDVMDAIQRMRDRAAQSGKLRTTAEQQVIRVVEEGQPIYEILPVNPTVIYVPVYDPYWIWGAAIYYPYPRWYYPPHAPYLYFNSGIYIDAYFGSGWYGSGWYGPSYRVWNNWGWRPAWNSRTVVVNNVFIDNHRFNSNRPRGVTGTTVWSHDGTHRRGVVYPTSASYDRYRRDTRDVARPQQVQGGRSVPSQVVSRSAGTVNSSRTTDRAYERNDRPDSRQVSRTDSRQDTRPDARSVRPDSRPDSRTDTPQDNRVAGRESTPNTASRNDRNDSDFRSDRPSSSRTTSRPVQVAGSIPTHVTPMQVTLSRPATPAPDVSRSRGTAQSSPDFRDNQTGRSVGNSTTRPPSAGSTREMASARSTAPSITQVSPSRPSSTTRVAGPDARYSPSQQSAPSSIGQASPRQSSPGRSASPEVRYSPSVQSSPAAQTSSPRQSSSAPAASPAGRSAPAPQTSQSSSSSGSGPGRSSNGGGNGGSSNGGNSRGGR